MKKRKISNRWFINYIENNLKEIVIVCLIFIIGIIIGILLINNLKDERKRTN